MLPTRNPEAPSDAPSKRPAQERRSRSKPSPHRRDQQHVAFLQFAFVNRSPQSNGYRPRRRVPEAIDIDDDFFQRHSQPVGRRGDNPAIRLMRDEAIHILPRELIALQDPLRHLRHLLHRILEDVFPILMDVMHLLIDGLMARWILAPSPWHKKVLPAHAL